VTVGEWAADFVERAEHLVEVFFQPVEEADTAVRSKPASLHGRAVVGREDDQRIVEATRLAQGLDESADLLIGVFDHRCVCLLQSSRDTTLGVGQRVPCRRIGVLRWQLRTRRDDAHVELTFVALSSNFVPTHVVASTDGIHVCGGCVVWRVRGTEG